MKLKCPSCGKKEAELLSKAEIKMRKNTLAFLPPTVFENILGMIDDWTSAKFLVCGSCGHFEKQ